MAVLVKRRKGEPMAADTRNRMIEATVSALQQHGVAGMSFTDVLRDSGAARGAIYHHFPGGKRQLVGEAAESNGRQVHERLAALTAGSPRSIVEEFLAMIRPVVQAAACGSGCAVAAVTVAAGQDSGDLRRIADSAFNTWTDELAARLTASGLPPHEAHDLAATLITLLEGAQVLCRASGTLDPFERVVRTVASLPLSDLARQEPSLVMINGIMSLTSNKLVVTSAIDAVLGARDLDAIDRFFAADYIQHSATGADGPGALRELLGGMPEGFRYERVRILGDGDLVACHGVYYGAEDWPLAGFDVFRIAKGKLAEHWDNHQRLGGSRMLDGPAEVTLPAQTEATRAVVNAFVDGMLVAGLDPAWRPARSE